MLIFHLTGIELWESQRNFPVYEHPSIHAEGFIHASTENQLRRTLGRFFLEAKKICLLGIETEKAGKVIFEDTSGEGLQFPHIYNPIPEEAILSSRYFENAAAVLAFLDGERTLIQRVLELASVPSFSSYEERLFPTVVDLLRDCPEIDIQVVPNRNLIVKHRNRAHLPAVILSAHLDKINHFGSNEPARLKTFEWKEEIEGLLDDSAGLGTVLSLFRDPKLANVNVILALSEIEEGTGLRFHPELMRDGGKGFSHGMGARTLGKHFFATEQNLKGFLTIDTTPFFKGNRGIALYSNHWELNNQTPSETLVSKTNALCENLSSIEPDLKRLNNTNDYLEYGKVLIDNGLDIPCVALEPAIFPYHQANERVFKTDLERIYALSLETVLWMAND